jgi:hypothetical protein
MMNITLVLALLASRSTTVGHVISFFLTPCSKWICHGASSLGLSEILCVKLFLLCSRQLKDLEGFAFP